MKVVLYANTDWFMHNFNLPLATKLRDQGYDVILLTPPGSYSKNLIRLGYRWVGVPMCRRSLNPFREFTLVLWLARFFKKERIDLVHAFTLKCTIYASLAAIMSGVPSRINALTGMGYVFTSADLKARLLRPLVCNLMKLAFRGRGVRLVVLNNEDLIFAHRFRLIDPSFVRYVPGAGIDCSRFSPTSSGSKHTKFRVLLPARLLWDKGIAEYVDAARLLKAEGRDIDFLIAGLPDAGNPASVPETLINTWVKEGIIQWLGHVEDMPELYRSVTVVVLPSYREGLPTCLTEAAASALALVTTNVPGCREVVTHEVDGLLVPAGDYRALAAAIARLQDNPDLCLCFGQRARKKALSTFATCIITESTLAIYSELTSRVAAGD